MGMAVTPLNRSPFRLFVSTVLLAGLATCGGGGDDPEQSIQSLGSTFQLAFAQGPNDAPVDVSNADLQVQLVQDPFEL